METLLPSRKGRLARAALRLQGKRVPPARVDTLPSIPVPAAAIRVLSDPAEFRSVLLKRISEAQRRIILVALYLQDDTAGREIMDALYAAHRARPGLEIQILVDWHRGQRGLIGKTKSLGNAAMYQEYAARYGPGVNIVGVPVHSRELFGVLHLKGFILDDTVLYSGASLNDVYLARHGRYRLDRYHLFENKPLADCLADFVWSMFLESPAVCPLNQPIIPTTRSQASAIRVLRRKLRNARYPFLSEMPSAKDVQITPLIGFGGTGNALNEVILALVNSTQHRLIIYTPYFNLPGPLSKAISHLLANGREVVIVIGDKTANDFYIPPSEPFKTIGLLPYLYEANLRRFAKKHAEAIGDGRLNIHLWRHEDNTFHLKGVFIDDEFTVVTGNNLNPRAWTMDLENGLVIRDPHGLLTQMHTTERAVILGNTTRLGNYRDLETPRHYPQAIQKSLKRLNRIRLDRLVNRLL